MIREESIPKLKNFVLSVLKLNTTIDELFSHDEKIKFADKIVMLFDGVELEKYCQELENEGNKKAKKLASRVAETYYYFDAFKRTYIVTEEEERESLRPISASILIGLFFTMLEILLEVVTHIRKTLVLNVLSEIDIRKTVSELNEIDLQLNEFVKHNNLNAFHDSDLYPEDIIQQAREQLNRISLNYGKTRLIEQEQNGSNENDNSVDFPVVIFLKLYNYQLFLHLVENYAKEKRPVDLSHIFRWMEEEQLIAKRSGKKYMKYCVENKIVVGKFARMADPDSKTRTPLNELRRAFNALAS